MNPIKTNNDTHPKYRADIDGLRAIAVMLVVFFHAFPNQVKGGFVGVDVFFVISGFLISTIIFNGLVSGGFSFSDFYIRRVLRIFPALLTILISCYIFGWFNLLVNEFQQLGKHILAATVFISNFTLWFEAGYFDTASELKPLLHLWSLGIEEQFYIFWPLVLWLSWKLKILRGGLILSIAAVSFYFNLKGVHSQPVGTFYSPLTRFWELILGSLLGHIHVFKPAWAKSWLLNSPDTPKKNLLRNLQSFAGFALLAIAVVTLSKFSPFPGWQALLPTLGTLLIISAGSEAWLNRHLLSTPMLVWVGLISYPLYLWHWPLFSYTRIIIVDELSPAQGAALVFASILLAWLTFKFIEIPLRFKSQNRRKVFILIGLMVSVAGVGFVTSKSGFPQRYKFHINDANIREINHRVPSVVDCGGLDTLSSSYCYSSAKTPNIAILGDSHAGHLFQGFRENQSDFFNKALLIYAGSCQPTLGFESRPGCGAFLEKALEKISHMSSIRYVIVASYYDIAEVSESEVVEKYQTGYLKTLNKITEMGKKAVFIVDPPTLKQSAERCSTPNLYLRREFKSYPSFCKGATVSDLKSRMKYHKYIESMKKKAKDVFFYDPNFLFCPQDICKVFNGEELLYNDNNHLSIYGSHYLVKDLIKQLETKTSHPAP